ncbi:MAG TPA: hypothetical protein VN033_11760 [Vulgatibacter sp.]|nr:hypothetical protein [Vulgatibacter sp.]
MSKALLLAVGIGLLLPAAAWANQDDNDDDRSGSAMNNEDGWRNRRYTGPVLAVDVNAVVRLRNTAKHHVQPGVGGRLGYQIWTGGTTMLTPEAMFEWNHFEEDNNAIRVLGGLRYSAGEVVRPSVFGHAGWGRVTFPGDDSDHAFAVDAGAALDVYIANTIAVGAQGAYNLINLDVPVDFLTFGAHLQFTF